MVFFTNKKWTNFILMELIILITLTSQSQSQDISITITDKSELDMVEGTTPSTCQYFEEYASLCKKTDTSVSFKGFWSSCDSPTYCDISISVGKLGGFGRVPSSLRLLTYVKGPDAVIEVRFRQLPGGTPITIPGAYPITNSQWFLSSPYDLSQLNMMPNSEIVIRLSSGEYDTSADILDRVIFTFTETEPPTTTTTIGTTTQVPPNPTTMAAEIPDIILDLEEDLIGGWINLNCAYNSKPQDFINCPFNVNPTDPDSSGYWSSCGRPSCTMMFAIGRYTDLPLPTGITLTTFVTGSTLVHVNAKFGDAIQHVGTIVGTNGGWTNTTFDLTSVELNEESILFLESISPLTGTNIDLIDKVCLSFN